MFGGRKGWRLMNPNPRNPGINDMSEKHKLAPGVVVGFFTLLWKTNRKTKRGPAPGLQSAAQLAGWCSPSSRDWKDTPGMATTGTNPDGSERKRLDQLPRQATLAGWATPDARGMNDGESLPIAIQVKTISGLPRDGSNAETGSADVFQLNPRFSLWLQGYPTSWHDAGLRAQQSLAEAETALSPN